VSGSEGRRGSAGPRRRVTLSSRPIVSGSPYYELIRPIPRLGKLRLVLEILVDYVRIRWLLARRDLPTVVTGLRGVGPRATDAHLQAAGKRLGHAVGRTLRPLPFDSRCLVRSLVLTSMLARRGIDSVLVIGVQVAPGFSAHAWVESGGMALLEPLDDGSRLVEL
jgi:Transglutaminase-like superfamily